MGRRGRKPKVPKKIPQDEPAVLDHEPIVVPETLDPPAVIIGKRTRGSSRKSDSEPSTSSSAMEEIPLASPKLEKEEKPLVSPKEKTIEKSNFNENYKKIQ